MARIKVSLKESLVEELRRVVPTRQRSQFISAAVQEKLDQLKQAQAVQAAAGIWSSQGRKDPGDEVRASRHGWQGRMERIEDEDHPGEAPRANG